MVSRPRSFGSKMSFGDGDEQPPSNFDEVTLKMISFHVDPHLVRGVHLPKLLSGFGKVFDPLVQTDHEDEGAFENGSHKTSDLILTTSYRIAGRHVITYAQA